MMVPAAAIVAMTMVMPATALVLGVLVLNRRLLAKLGYVGIHRLASRLVAKEVLDLVMDIR